MTSADVVRHPLVARIVDAYDMRGGDRDEMAAEAAPARARARKRAS
jgi:phosphate starvation-inducible protein PhoH and related proteins